MLTGFSSFDFAEMFVFPLVLPLIFLLLVPGISLVLLAEGTAVILLFPRFVPFAAIIASSLFSPRILGVLPPWPVPFELRPLEPRCP